VQSKLVAAVLGVSFLTALSLRAHDPYEITSEVRLYSNRTAVEIEMEYRTALRLAGAQPRFDLTPAEQMAAHLERLMSVAGGFFQISAPDGVLVAVATNVTLGVEDHAQFKLDYPPALGVALRLDPQALRSASSDDPYGTTLTVLDMENKKVLGQTVFFAASSAAEFAPATVAPAQVSGTSPPALVPTAVLEPRLSPPDSETVPAPVTTTFPWRWVALVLVGFVFFVTVSLLRQRRQ